MNDFNKFIETINLPSGRIIGIFYDTDPENPMTEFDRLGTIITTNNRYFTGDEIIDDDWEEKREEIEDEGGIVLPLYMLAHSVIHLSLDPFADRWDSGCVGFVYVTREKLSDEYKNYALSSAQAYARKCIHGEIDSLNMYLNGEVYGATIQDANGDTVDSICGIWCDLEEVPEAVAEHFYLSDEEQEFISNL